MRLMSASTPFDEDLSSFLKSFYLKAHPDLFTNFPEEKARPFLSFPFPFSPHTIARK